jgi:hypothetical protein
MSAPPATVTRPPSPCTTRCRPLGASFELTSAEGWISAGKGDRNTARPSSTHPRASSLGTAPNDASYDDAYYSARPGLAG